MKFKEWSDSNQSKINDFLNKVDGIVLASVKQQEESITFSFPDYEQIAPDEEIASDEEQPVGRIGQSQMAPMRLAASVDPEKTIQESYDHVPFGKGEYAFRSIAKHPIAMAMTPKQIVSFKKKFKLSLRNIAKEMGLIFELDVYSNLMKKGLKSINLGQGAIDNQINAYYASISTKTDPDFTKQIEVLIQHHSNIVADSIIRKSKEMLSCKNFNLSFEGGTGAGARFAGNQVDQRGYRKTSDLTISCNKGYVGFSTKFTSESDIRVADLWIKSAYVLLGGKDVLGFSSKLKTLKDEPSIRKFVVDVLEILLNKLAKQPTRLNFIINRLLSGTEKDEEGGEKISNVFPAMRNYLQNKGEADFSDRLKNDFIVDPNAELKLRIKPKADIQVRKTAVAASIHIISPGGNSKGTIIRFRVDADRIIVYMNNLY